MALLRSSSCCLVRVDGSTRSVDAMVADEVEVIVVVVNNGVSPFGLGGENSGIWGRSY